VVASVRRRDVGWTPSIAGRRWTLTLLFDELKNIVVLNGAIRKEAVHCRLFLVEDLENMSSFSNTNNSM
jgi:hypothetical protein